MSTDSQLTFKLARFEGPLDLLLHLIKQNKMDLADIEMTPITTQYLDYLNQMRTLQLDVAGEYLVMAATLLKIKAQMLLPRPQPLDEPATPDVDPREELVAQLKVHQAYQLVAKKLATFEHTSGKQFSRPQATAPQLVAKTLSHSAQTDVALLQQAFLAVVAQRKLTKVTPPQITPERFPLKEETKRLKHYFQTLNHPVVFTELFATAPLEQVVTGFLAVLELMKQQVVAVTQEQAFGPILIQRRPANASESSQN